MTKIYISGGPGSGKTTYARALSKQLNIPHFDLDEVKWINHKGIFNQKRPKEERIALLSKILVENKDWILEGVYFQDWIIPVVEQADRIIILKTARWKRQFRIVRRSLKRALHLAPKKHKENPIVLWKLLSWSHEYETKYLPMLLEKVEKAGKKCEILTKSKRRRKC